MPQAPWRRPGPVIAVAIATAAGLWVASGEIGAERRPEARKPPAKLEQATVLPKVRTRSVTAQARRETLRLQGQSSAHRSATLRAEAEGRLVALTIDKGDSVAAGDTLVRIDPRGKPAALAEAKAYRQQRRLELDAARRLAEKGHRSATQLAQARAQYEQAEAQVNQAEVALAGTTVTAPFAGRIAERPVEMGDYVTPGTELARLVELDPITLVAQVSERDIAALGPGDPVQARTVGGTKLSGRLTYVGSVANTATRTFQIEAEAPNPQLRVRAGVTLDITIPLKAAPAHRIPTSALTLADDGRVGVKLLDDADRVRFHPVTIESESADAVWVAGLPDEVRLIVLGQNFVETGQQVAPVPNAAASGSDATPVPDTVEETAP